MVPLGRRPADQAGNNAGLRPAAQGCELNNCTPQAIEQAFSAIFEAPPEDVRSASGGDQIDQESRSRLADALLP